MKIAYIFMFLILLNTCLAAVTAGGLGGNTPRVVLQLLKDPKYKKQVRLRTDLNAANQGIILDLVDNWEYTNSAIALPEVYKNVLLPYHHNDNPNQYIIPFRFVRRASYHYGGFSTTNKQSIFNLQPDDDKPSLTIYFISKYHNWNLIYSNEEMSEDEISDFANVVAKLGGNARQEIISQKTSLNELSDHYSETKQLIDVLKKNNAADKTKFLTEKNKSMNSVKAEIKTYTEERNKLNTELTSISENATKLDKELKAAIKANEKKIEENKKAFDAKQTDFEADSKKIQEAQKALSAEEAKNATLKTKYQSTLQKYNSEETKLQLEKKDLEDQLKAINDKLAENVKALLANGIVKENANAQKKTYDAAVVANKAAITAEEAKLKDLEAKQKKYNDDYQAELTKSNAEAQKELQAKQKALDAVKEKENQTKLDLETVKTQIDQKNNSLNNINLTINNLTGLNIRSADTYEADLKTTQANYNNAIPRLITKLQGAAIGYANESKGTFNSKVNELSKISPKISNTSNVAGGSTGAATKIDKKKRLLKNQK